MSRKRERKPRHDGSDKYKVTRIPADSSQQVPNNSYSPPPEFYENKVFTCVDCGKEEIWTAAQQKWWYEVAKGSLFSTAVRCHKCRQAKRVIDQRSCPPDAATQ